VYCRSPRVNAVSKSGVVSTRVSASGCQLSPDSAIMAAMPLCRVYLSCRSPRVNAVSKSSGVVSTRVSASGCQLSPDSAIMAAMPFCSELILWRVSPVGPLSKSGGLTELARINSPAVSAFTNVAWLPTLLPRSVVIIFTLSC